MQSESVGSHRVNEGHFVDHRHLTSVLQSHLWGPQLTAVGRANAKTTKTSSALGASPPPQRISPGFLRSKVQWELGASSSQERRVGRARWEWHEQGVDIR